MPKKARPEDAQPRLQQQISEEVEGGLAGAGGGVRQVHADDSRVVIAQDAADGNHVPAQRHALHAVGAEHFQLVLELLARLSGARSSASVASTPPSCVQLGRKACK